MANNSDSRRPHSAALVILGIVILAAIWVVVNSTQVVPNGKPVTADLLATDVSPADVHAPTTAPAADRHAKFNAIYDAKENVRELLKDPESADFSDVTTHVDGANIVVCGWVNAKNGYGGYTGREPFIGGSDGSMIRNEVIATLFRKEWNRVCL